MNTANEKTTIYLNPLVKKFIQHKAVEDDSSVSGVINDYFADMLEDLDDIKAIEERRGGETMTLEELLKDLNLKYEDLRD